MRMRAPQNRYLNPDQTPKQILWHSSIMPSQQQPTSCPIILLSLPLPLPIKPLTNSIPPNQTPRPNIIARPKQLRNIHIQRTVRLRTSEQLVYARHRARNGIRRRPSRLEQVEADLAGFEIDVGVADGRYEADGGWREGILRGDRDGEEPAAVCGIESARV